MRVALMSSLLLALSAPAAAQSPATASAEPAAAAGPQRVLLLPFTALGQGAELAGTLRNELAGAIDRLEGGSHKAIDAKEAESLLGRPLPQVRDECAEDNLCLSSLGRVANARFVVLGGVAANGSSYKLVVRGLDTTTSRSKELPPFVLSSASPEDVVRTTRTAATALFVTRGSLVLLCPVAGAEVMIDGKPMGATTGAPRTISNLPLGKVTVNVRKQGYDEFMKVVEVRAGESTSVSADLRSRAVARNPAQPGPRGKPLTRRPVFWAGVGAAALALGAGAFAASAGSAGTKTVTRENPDDDGNTSLTTW